MVNLMKSALQAQSATGTPATINQDALSSHSPAYDTLQMAARMAPALYWCKQWAKDHPPRNIIPLTRSEIRKNYRARKKKARGSFTDLQFKSLCDIYGNKCLRCGSTTEKLIADHVRPLSRGGNNTIKNIQPLCFRCNCWKHAKTIDYRPFLVSIHRSASTHRSRLLYISSTHSRRSAVVGDFEGWMQGQLRLSDPVI
jgi:5-methylcytosine-specific restriction endonuclease McrA